MTTSLRPGFFFPLGGGVRMAVFCSAGGLTSIFSMFLSHAASPASRACAMRAARALAPGPSGWGMKKRFFVDFPRGGQPAPIGEVAIPVDEALEYLIDDGAARRVGVKNGVQDLGVADGAGDELAKALVPPLGLVGKRRYPEVGLKQDGRDENGSNSRRRLISIVGPQRARTAEPVSPALFFHRVAGFAGAVFTGAAGTIEAP